MVWSFWDGIAMSDHQGLDSLFADLPEVLSTPEVAKLLNMSVPGVQKWLKEGVIPGYKVGRTWFVTKHDLRATFQAGANTKPSRETEIHEG
ncbi:helix-turn-helix domain-containing protein [Pseudoclavibacter terrae]|nr:helix-turn-helix domain-containing protein [Pseudoclavibacter terrae]